jgi:uncharacterized protein
MIDDALVFDGVVHFFDFSVDQLEPGSAASERLDVPAALEDYNRLMGGLFEIKKYYVSEGKYAFPAHLLGSLKATHDELFLRSPTDMIVLGNTPFNLDGRYAQSDSVVRRLHEFAQRYPERTILGGGTDPNGFGMGPRPGLNYALEQIDFQIRELGVKSLKFYPFTWRCDDENIAYPMFERCRSLGVNVIQVHKNMSALAENIEMQRPNDLQGAARDFPDLTFIMHHPMPLYLDETINIAARFPNIYLLLSPLIQFLTVKPRLAYEIIGQLLEQVGSERLIWGSEGLAVGNPTRYIEAFWNASMPADLQEGYGYPDLTREDKERILGTNLCRVFGIDAAEARARSANHHSGR